MHDGHARLPADNEGAGSCGVLAAASPGAAALLGLSATWCLLLAGRLDDARQLPARAAD